MTEQKKKAQLVEESDLAGTYSAADYLTWKLDELVELIRGKVFKMSAAPNTNHQRVSRELQALLYDFFKHEKCELFDAPFDVYLVEKGQSYKESENVVEPDLCVVCDAEKIQSFGCVGSPDLIVEIISPSTAKKDQQSKKEIYEEFGVQEYWMIFPGELTVHQYFLENGTYRMKGVFAEDQSFNAILFPELAIDLREVFKDVGPHHY
jgi:Uma2 family endonuclease